MVIFQSYLFPAATLLRITPEHYANIGKNDTQFKDFLTSKTTPYPAAQTYIVHMWEYTPPPGYSRL